MHEAKIPRAIFDLVRPATISFVHRLLLLTHGRPGSVHSKLEVSTLFETGLVTSLYEYLLMSPVFREYEIRREWKVKTGAKCRPKQIDLWLRPLKGGRPYLIEAGDFTPAKAKQDLNKVYAYDPKAYHYFLAFFRDKPAQAKAPFDALRKSADRQSNGLDTCVVDYNAKYCGSFEVFTSQDRKEAFGYALLRRK
jgi:hypothetical protein